MRGREEIQGGKERNERWSEKERERKERKGKRLRQRGEGKRTWVGNMERKRMRRRVKCALLTRKVGKVYRSTSLIAMPLHLLYSTR